MILDKKETGNETSYQEVTCMTRRKPTAKDTPYAIPQLNTRTTNLGTLLK